MKMLNRWNIPYMDLLCMTGKNKQILHKYLMLKEQTPPNLPILTLKKCHFDLLYIIH